MRDDEHGIGEAFAAQQLDRPQQSRRIGMPAQEDGIRGPHQQLTHAGIDIGDADQPQSDWRIAAEAGLQLAVEANGEHARRQ
jgi:hypothetical protein